MANQQNLKSWQPGQSGNPTGKPKGTKHISTWIQNILEDGNFTYKLRGKKTKTGAPLKAILEALVIKALEGDMRAFDLLCKYGYGQKYDVTSKDEKISFSWDVGIKRFVKSSEAPNNLSD